MRTESQFLGDLSPLLSRRQEGLPDRRQVSKRWLASAVLVGMTSVFLMGGALFTALDGRQQLTVPAQAYEHPDIASNNDRPALRGNHPGLFANIEPSASNIMMVSTVTKIGNENIVKVRPFLHVNAPLALAVKTKLDYPSFNPLSIFSEAGNTEIIARDSGLIYGADVEGEVTLKTVDFPFDLASATLKPRQQIAQVEDQVRSVAANLVDGFASVSALSYFDAERFSPEDQPLLSLPGVTITAENVSVVTRVNPNQAGELYYVDRIIEIRAETTIAAVFSEEGLDGSEVELVQTILSSDLGTSTLKPGDRMQIILELDQRSSQTLNPTIARVSVYRGAAHLVSIARTDNRRFVYAVEPLDTRKIAAEELSAPLLARSRLPTAYDGIYRAALSQGINNELAQALVKIFAFDVDFKTKVSIDDELSVFVSLDEGEEKPTEASEILFASITLGDHEWRYYRYRDADSNRVDYYDESGKSAKKFLLRQPVPNGRFRSQFGKRWHPILKYKKMHWGVDWSAPRGTPILAAGNGVIEKAGWSGTGYGKQTIIRHANGYKTSYSHQTAIAKGIAPGIRIRQGQVIGYVGSTGLSTGPHLHYEVSVNSNKVDPMRIRLPKGKVLKGEELQAFEAERDRIDTLLKSREEDATHLALN